MRIRENHYITIMPWTDINMGNFIWKVYAIRIEKEEPESVPYITPITQSNDLNHVVTFLAKTAISYGFEEDEAHKMAKRTADNAWEAYKNDLAYYVDTRRHYTEVVGN